MPLSSCGACACLWRSSPGSSLPHAPPPLVPPPPPQPAPASPPTCCSPASPAAVPSPTASWRWQRARRPAPFCRACLWTTCRAWVGRRGSSWLPKASPRWQTCRSGLGGGGLLPPGGRAAPAALGGEGAMQRGGKSWHALREGWCCCASLSCACLLPPLCSQVRSRAFLQGLLGPKQGAMLWDFAAGIDKRHVGGARRAGQKCRAAGKVSRGSAAALQSPMLPALPCWRPPYRTDICDEAPSPAQPAHAVLSGSAASARWRRRQVEPVRARKSVGAECNYALRFQDLEDAHKVLNDLGETPMSSLCQRGTFVVRRVRVCPPVTHCAHCATHLLAFVTFLLPPVPRPKRSGGGAGAAAACGRAWADYHPQADEAQGGGWVATGGGGGGAAGARTERSSALLPRRSALLHHRHWNHCNFSTRILPCYRESASH